MPDALDPGALDELLAMAGGDPELLLEDPKRALPVPVEGSSRLIVVEDEGLTGAGFVGNERGPRASVLGCEHTEARAGDVQRVRTGGVARHRRARRPAARPELLGGITALRVAPPGAAPFDAIPYFAWNNRGLGPMAVWLGVGK